MKEPAAKECERCLLWRAIDAFQVVRGGGRRNLCSLCSPPPWLGRKRKKHSKRMAQLWAEGHRFKAPEPPGPTAPSNHLDVAWATRERQSP
jgi:hypothetical protein